MGFLDDAIKKQKEASPFLKTGQGMKHTLHNIKIEHDYNAKFKINNKDYAIKISGDYEVENEEVGATGSELPKMKDKILMINTNTGETALIELGNALRKEEKELEGATIHYDHPSEGMYVFKSQGIISRVVYDKLGKSFHKELDKFEEEIPF